jgi:hypothetical protein
LGTPEHGHRVMRSRISAHDASPIDGTARKYHASVGLRLRAIGRSLAIASAALLVLCVLAGARPVYARHQLRCIDGYAAHPVGVMAGVYQCQAQGPSRAEWPQVVTTQDEVGLYLTNLNVRVFHFDFVRHTYDLFALDVPYSPRSSGSAR